MQLDDKRRRREEDVTVDKQFCCCMSGSVWTGCNNIDCVPDLADVIRAESWIHHFPKVLPLFKVWGTKNIVVRLALHHIGVSEAAGRS